MITLTAGARYGYGGKQYIARIFGRDSKFTFNREFIGKKGGKRGENSTADVDTPGLYETRDVDSKGRCDDSYCLILEDGDRLVQFWIDKANAMKIAKELDSRSFDRCVKLLPSDAEFRVASERLRKNSEAINNSFGKDPEEFVELSGNVGPYVKGQSLRRLQLIELRTEVINDTIDKIEQYRSEKRRKEDDWKFVSAADEKKAEAEAAKAEAEAASTNALETCFNVLNGLPEKDAKKILAELKSRLFPKVQV